MQIDHATTVARRTRRDKRYLEFPMGQEGARYLAIKGKRLTDASLRGYEACLAELAMFYPEHTLEQFMPPTGVELLEEFLHARWGHSAPRTYNKNLSILSDFFKWQATRQRLHGDPTLPIERAKKKAVYRTTFTPEQRDVIIAAGRDERERIALRLLLNYGIRKGTLQRVQFRHFNHERRQIDLFTKGNKNQTLPLPQDQIWNDLDKLLIDGAQPHHYLLPRQKVTVRPTEARKVQRLREELLALQLMILETEERAEWVKRWPDEPMGEHAAHDWWYRVLGRAGIVEPGVTSGERMHKARHTAGQFLLDKTGNLKVVQVTLGHASVQTTGDIYTDWDDARHTESLRQYVVA